MGIDKFNAEGYYDPTCYEAMTNGVKADRQSAFRPMVYICSPFSGDTEYNTVQARKYSRFAYEQNTIPVTPHLCIRSSWMMKIQKNVPMPCISTMCFLASAMNCGCSVM